MKTLQELRVEIDDIDEQMTSLFVKRMEAVTEIGKIKKSQGLPVQNRQREEQILEARAKQVSCELAESVKEFYEAVFAVSRSYQQKELISK